MASRSGLGALDGIWIPAYGATESRRGSAQGYQPANQVSPLGRQGDYPQTTRKPTFA